MKSLFEEIKNSYICRKKRTKMIKTYLSGTYFQFDSDNHVSFCPKCQLAGKRYRAFREELETEVEKEIEVPEDFASVLAPFRVKRKKLATVCLFLVISAIILGVQTYVRYDPIVTIGLIVLAGIFSYRANKSLIRFGWF